MIIRPRKPFQFGIRFLFVLIFLAAILFCWYTDRMRLQHDLAQREYDLNQKEKAVVILRNALMKRFAENRRMDRQLFEKEILVGEQAEKQLKADLEALKKRRMPKP